MPKRKSPPRNAKGRFTKGGAKKRRAKRRPAARRRAPCRPTKSAVRRAAARVLKAHHRKRVSRKQVKAAGIFQGRDAAGWGMNPRRKRRKSRRRRNATGFPFSGKTYRPRIRVRGGSGRHLIAGKTRRQRALLKAYSNPRRKRRNPRRKRHGLGRPHAYWFNAPRRRSKRRHKAKHRRRHARRHSNPGIKLGGFKIAGIRIPSVSGAMDFAVKGGVGLAGLAIAFKLPELLAPKLARIHPSLAKLDSGWGGVLGSAAATGVGFALVKKFAPKTQKFAGLANVFLIGGAIGTAMRLAFQAAPRQSRQYLPAELQGGAVSAQDAVNSLLSAQMAMKAAGVNGMFAVPTATARDIVAGERGVRDYIQLSAGAGVRDYVNMGVADSQSKSGKETF